MKIIDKIVDKIYQIAFNFALDLKIEKLERKGILFIENLEKGEENGNN
jgi:hypothetical protein